MEAIWKRVSVRKFEETQVEPEKIEQLMKAAMAAPSSCNQQPWEFMIVTDKEKLLELSNVHPFAMAAKNAPMAIVPCYYEADEKYVMAQFKYIDLSISCSNILLEAVNLDLGGVWLAVAPFEECENEVAKIVGAPDYLRPFCIIPIGYPSKIREWQSRYDESKVHYID